MLEVFETDPAFLVNIKLYKIFIQKANFFDIKLVAKDFEYFFLEFGASFVQPE